MKVRTIAVLTVLAMMFSVAAMAAPNKKAVHFIQPVLVGNVTLQAGDYTMEWNGTAPDVQVSFSQGKHTIVTVPATIKPAKNPQDSVTLITAESEASSLVEIKTKNSTLSFGPGGLTAGK